MYICTYVCMFVCMYIVRAKFRMVIKPAALLRTTVKLPKRLDFSKLHSAEFQEALAKGMNAVAYTLSWDATKDDLYKVAEETVGTVAAKSRDWFDENDQAISDVLAAKNNIRSRMMQKDQPRITPLRSKDGKEVHNTMEKISNRWKEHFSELLNRKSQVAPAALERIQQRPKVDLLNDLPTLEEVQTSISKLNLGKAAGRDGLFSGIFRVGGNHTAVVMHAVISDVWEKGEVPKDWRDAIMIPLYKGKEAGKGEVCGNYRGITLLSSAGKILAGILLSRLNAEIVKTILPESQCGFRQNRGTTDIIFTVRQIQEKCSEHRQGLYQVFVDLTKAFDSVNRETLWKILGKLGCPDHFVKLIRSFHDEMEVSVNVGGTLTDPLKVETGVKQGDLLAPTLFSVFFSIVLNDAFRDCNQGIYIRYRSSGKLFNIRRFAAKTKVLLALVRDLLYADDCDLVAHTESDMQCLMDRPSEA